MPSGAAFPPFALNLNKFFKLFSSSTTLAADTFQRLST